MISLIYSSLIFYFNAISTKFLIAGEELNNIKKPIAGLIIFLFGFTWTVPHCCKTNLKFVYQKPLSNIITINKKLD